MNYLSHLFLAEDTEESKIGNLLGDFVKGRLNDDFSPEIINGIKTHRKIDLFTDSHETVRQTKKLISPERRKYSGVLIDIFFDHFLTLQWQIYSDKDFDLFIEDTYKILLKYQDIYPFKGKALITCPVPTLNSNGPLSLIPQKAGGRLNLELVQDR